VQESPAKKKPGPKGITIEDVGRAARALEEQGRLVGPFNVRLELGRGSYGTITRLLKELGLSVQRRSEQDKNR
jgi:Plasmid replication region DNA-binding N-term